MHEKLVLLTNYMLKSAELPYTAKVVPADDFDQVDDEITILDADGREMNVTLQIGYDYLGVNRHNYDEKGELKSMNDCGIFDRDKPDQCVAKLIEVVKEGIVPVPEEASAPKP